MEHIIRNHYNYLISVIIPSKRPDGLNGLINSLLTHSNPLINNFEIIVKIDFEELNQYNLTQYSNLDNINFIISTKKQGYVSLINFEEDMVKLSNSQYCFLLTDDTQITTPNWNSILQEQLTEFKVYFPLIEWEDDPINPQFCFPIFPKKLLDIWGYLAPHSLVDHWLHELAKRISNPNMPWNESFLQYLDNIKVQGRKNPSHETSVDKSSISSQLYQTCIYHTESPEFFHCINLLKEYLVKRRYDDIHKHNIINEYKNSLES